MDRYSLALLAPLPIACALAPHAARSTELRVTGLITPSAAQDLNARLTTFTTIVPANDLTLSAEAPMERHITVQLNY